MTDSYILAQYLVGCKSHSLVCVLDLPLGHVSCCILTKSDRLASNLNNETKTKYTNAKASHYNVITKDNLRNRPTIRSNWAGRTKSSTAVGQRILKLAGL